MAVKVRQGPSARGVPVVVNVRAGQSPAGLRRIRAQRLKFNNKYHVAIDAAIR